MEITPSLLKFKWALRLQMPEGAVTGKRHALYFLYDEGKAAMASRKCTRCGWIVGHKRDLHDGLCPGCRFEVMIEYAHEAAVEWARQVLADPGAMVLDTETTGLDFDDEVVEIAILEVASGKALLNTLIRPTKSIPADVSDIHGITDEEVKDAPTFLEIYPKLREVLGAASRCVTYNAEFDERMLAQSATAHGGTGEMGKLPEERFQCAMEAYAEFVGDWSDKFRSFKYKPLCGGHRALGDCEAVVERLREMARGESWRPF